MINKHVSDGLDIDCILDDIPEEKITFDSSDLYVCNCANEIKVNTIELK